MEIFNYLTHNHFYRFIDYSDKLAFGRIAETKQFMFISLIQSQNKGPEKTKNSSHVFKIRTFHLVT